MEHHTDANPDEVQIVDLDAVRARELDRTAPAAS
jgi:hypothetical protein